MSANNNANPEDQQENDDNQKENDNLPVSGRPSQNN